MADQPVAAADDTYFDQYSQPAQAQAPAAPPARSTATPVEVISPSEAKKRKDSGGYLASGQSAPEAAVVDTDQSGPPTPNQPNGNSQVASADDDYFDKQYGKPTEPPATPVKPVKPQGKSLGDRAWALTQGALGQSNRLAQLLSMAGETATSLTQKITTGMGYGEEGHNKVADALAKSYAENVTQPLADNQQNFDLGPDADFTDKALHGVGSTLMFIDQMIATGGDAAPAEAAATLPGRIGQGLVTGAAQAQVPAVANAIAVGKQVLKQTGNQDAATTAAITSYTTTIATAGAPMAFGKGLPTRLATAAAAGPVLGEVQRQVQNAAMPDEMKTPFNLEESAIEALTSAPFGLLPGHNGEQIPRAPDVQAATEKPQNIMEHAQSVAAAESAANGGDLLDQTVAATHANSVLSAHHDAAAYEMHIETRNAQAAQEAEVQRQEEAQAAADQAASAKNVPETPATLFDRRAQEMSASKDEDFTAAKNQVGDQEIERGDTLNAGEEKGGEGFEQPKLLDSLPPEQLQAFKTLAERRTAEIGGQEPPEAVNARLKAQNPEDNFSPYVEPKTKPGEIAPGYVKLSADEKGPSVMGKTTKAQRDAVEFSPSPETEPLLNPPQTLEERRAQEMQAEASAGKGGTTSPEVATNLPTQAPETLQARRESNGMQAPELPASEREPASGLLQAPDLRQTVDAAASESAYSPENEKPTPTQAQYEAGNYQKGHVDIQGMDVSIEHPAGSERPLGNGETRTMDSHYGYVKGTVGADGMHVDALIGKHPENETAFVVDHLGKGGEFEQHKVLLGFNNKIEAMRSYSKAYPDNPRGPVSEVKVPDLKKWLAQGDTTKPYDQKGVNRLADSRPRFADNNASGESPASLEAIRRVRDEAAQGKTRHLIDPDGNSTPLTGVDAVDAKAPKGHIIAQADGEGGHTVLDRGGLSALHANGLLNRARAKGLAEPEAAAARDAPAGWDKAEGAPPRLKQADVQKAIQPLLDKLNMTRDDLQVHQDSSTLPENIQQSMRDYNHPDPRGVYSPQTDTLHIIAGAHDTADQAMRTAVHEIVGHQSIRKLLGSDWDGTMADVYRSVKNSQWTKDYMQQHGLDPRNTRHQGLAADEYIAHLAERDVGDPNHENPGVLRKAMDAVRAGLRKLGLVREWSDNDVRYLLRQSANNLAAENAGIRESAQGKGNGDRFADREDVSAEQYPPDHPLAQAHKFGKTMEEQANYNPGYLKSRLDWAKDKVGETADARLAFIGLRNLPDFMDQKVMPSLRQFIRVHDQMDGRRGDLMNKAADLARDWSGYVSKDKARGGALGELMHASTLGGVDPSKPFEARYSDGEKTADATKAAHEDMRRDLHARLKEVFNKQLDDKGRELFNTVRDRYAQNRMEVFKALEARIMDSGADNNTKKMIMAEMRQKFESGKVQGPYFPLARFGDHWASAKDADGNTVSFSRFESASQKKAWIGEMKEKGFATDGGQRMDDKSLMERIDPKFVQKVTEMAKAVDPGLADEIWQAYLKAMPEMSMRKHFIHRVGRLGYSMDAMRAFAYNSFHGAHQLARLEYGNRLDSTLDNIKAEARAAESADPTSKNAQWAPALAREMSRRYEWIKNPRSSPLASALTKFGFGWYLGAAPATAFRIFSQNPMLAQPMLAKFHGQLGATRELSRASAQWARARGSLGDTLRGDERRAFDTADQMGMFSSTATQTLASGGAGEPMFTGTYYHVQKAMGYLFNAMEHHNRQTTYLAAYRLGRTQGMSHDAAVNHAGDLTWDSHFDYTNANRPRVLQNDAAKVALLFKQYSWGVTYRLAREARDMFNSELTPEQNVMARKAFAGLLTRGMMFAGASGLPLSWVATSVINAIMGDKDRPFDAEAAAHASLEQHLGKFAADAVMTGPVGAVTGASLSNGASYNDLWYRPPSRDEKPQEQWSDLTGQMLGAIPAIGTNIATGASMMHDGQVERGFEHFVPPEAAALMKAYRYSQEGVTNLRGEQVLTRDELDNKDLFLQAIGFSPQKVADAYARNTALKNVSQAIQDRREQILNHLQVASGMGDSDEIDKAMEEVEHFNSVNPGVAIAGKSVITSMRDRFKQSAESINGVRLPPGLNDLRDTYAPTEQQ